MAVRVLLVVKGLGPGGAERLLVAAANAHSVTALHLDCTYVLPYKDHLVSQMEAAGVSCTCLSVQPRDVRWPWRLRRMLRDGAFDIVHGHSPLPMSVTRLLVRTLPKANRPLTMSTEHNAWGTLRLPTRWLNRLTIRTDAAVFTVSNEVRASMHGSAARRAVTLTHGIDVVAVAAAAPDRAAVRTELGLAADSVVVGTVANFRAQKDYPNLLRAARELIDRGVAVQFVAVGQGPLEADIRALANDLRLDDCVLFTGFRADAVRVLAACDVFTLASQWEGLPVALMEACGLGLAVVATAVGGVAEVLRDGVDALLVPAEDHIALADALQRVIADGELRSRLSFASAARAADFDARRTQAVVEAAYARLAPAFVVSEVVSEVVSRAVPETPAAGPTVASRGLGGLDVRPATLDDRPAILALLEQTLGWDGDVRYSELFRWKHDLNVFGPSPMWVATDAGRVVGLRAFMRWEFLRGGQVLRAVRAVDTATHPDYQGRGLFTALTLHGLDALRDEGTDFVFNTPNPQSLPGYLKMGWREVGRLPAAVSPRSLASARRVLSARVPAEHWSQSADVGTAFTEWIERFRCTPEPADSVRSITTNESAAFLRWRYGLASMHYRVLEGNDGAAVVRVRRRGTTRELVLLDSFGLSPRKVDVLARTALQPTGSDHVLRLGPGAATTGFVPLPRGGPVLTWRALNEAGMPPLSNWSLIMGDVELF